MILAKRPRSDEILGFNNILKLASNLNHNKLKKYYSGNFHLIFFKWYPKWRLSIMTKSLFRPLQQIDVKNLVALKSQAARCRLRKTRICKWRYETMIDRRYEDMKNEKDRAMDSSPCIYHMFLWGESANAVPNSHKLCSRVSHIRGNRRLQPPLSAMEGSRPEGTALLITVSSEPGKYALVTF